MIGWTADFLRFWWALAYWNARKTWFRLRGAHRDACPCQNFSDSGLALDARCDAVTSWHQPRRFRRVCPLLTQTKAGWRCGVDAERVRPFWFRAFLYAGAGVLGLYLFATLAIFGVLRAADYPLSYAMVAWPGRWPELRVSQEKLYSARAQQALAAGNYPAAILSLQTVCRLNPRNLAAGLTLARLSQLSGQAAVADYIFARLMQDIPEQRPAIARAWIRGLVAAGNYSTIKPLATAMLSEDSGHREAWLHALVFAARQSKDAAALTPLLSGEHGLPDWCVEVATLEQLLLGKRPERALPRLSRVTSRPGSSYLPCYQADRLLSLNQAEPAVALLNAYGDRVPADEAAFLRMRAFDLQGWTSLGQAEFDSLMKLPANSRLCVLTIAFLIGQPSAERSARFLGRVMLEAPPLAEETLPLHHAAYLLAVQSDNDELAKEILGRITGFTKSDAKPLRGVAELFRAGAPLPQIRQLLPIVALPIEVVYAIQGRPEPPPRK